MVVRCPCPRGDQRSFPCSVHWHADSVRAGFPVGVPRPAFSLEGEDAPKGDFAATLSP